MVVNQIKKVAECQFSQAMAQSILEHLKVTLEIGQRGTRIEWNGPRSSSTLASF